MDSVWRFLPQEILETKILPFLPLSSLCRFKTISKKWNAWISHRDFAASHALAAPPEDYVLVTVEKYFPKDTCEGWDVMDVAHDEVFTLSGDFLLNHVPQDVLEANMVRRLLAADGGLFFIRYCRQSGPAMDNDVFLVCNPVSKSVKLLPRSPRSVSDDNVVMLTDRATMQYEIIVFYHEAGDFRIHTVDIYESRTGNWRMVEHGATLFTAPYFYNDSKFVKADLFYRLYYHLNPDLQPNLVAYDKATGRTSKLKLVLPTGSAKEVLVVSERQLYCILVNGVKRTDPRAIEIVQVDPVQLKCTKCADMPSKLVQWLYGDDLDQIFTDDVLDSYFEPVVYIGCASSIMMCSCVGRSVRYDLKLNSWHQYSDSNLLEVIEESSNQFMERLFCSSFCLSLCAP